MSTAIKSCSSTNKKSKPKSRKRFRKSMPVHEMYDVALAFGYDPKLTRSFVRKVLKLRDHNGQEYVTKVLKNLRTDLFMSYGDPNHQYQTEWVAKTPSGNFKGIYGRMFKDAMKSPEMLVKIGNLFRIYQCFVEENVTKQQASKFFDAVLGHKKTPEGYVDRSPVSPQSYHEMVLKALKKCQHLEMKRFPNDFGPLPKVGKPRPLKVKPVLGSMYMKTQDHQDSFIPEVQDFERSIIGHKLFRQTWFPQMWSQGAMLSEIFSATEQGISSVGNIGQIRVAQEPGCKARFYLDGAKWVQAVLEPLKVSLMSYLYALPWDGTHYQAVGHPAMLEAQRQGKFVWCFDLTNASDLIPRDLQFTALRSMYPNEVTIDFFDFVCQSPAKVDIKGVNMTSATWKRGQALGLGPSFGSFALIHGLLLFALNGYKWNGEFYIVGDDVVILCPILAERYKQMLDDLDLDWSPNKTLVSSRLAEFTGALVIDGKRVVNSYKWVSINKQNAADKLAHFHPSQWHRLVPTKYHRAIYTAVSQPAPLGAGINPNGISAENRLALANHRAEHEKDYYVHLSNKSDKPSQIEIHKDTKTYVLNPAQYVKDLYERLSCPRRRIDFRNQLASSQIWSRLQGEYQANLDYLAQLDSVHPQPNEAYIKSNERLDLLIKPDYNQASDKKLKRDAKKISTNVEKLVKEVNKFMDKLRHELVDHLKLVQAFENQNLNDVPVGLLNEFRTESLTAAAVLGQFKSTCKSKSDMAEAYWYEKRFLVFHNRVSEALESQGFVRGNSDC